MSNIQSNPEQPTHALFQIRWSPRAFDASKDVSAEHLVSCLEAARWAPSCFGDQPWRFVVCHRSVDEVAWQRLLACLTPKNQEWAKNAPVLMMICANTVFAHNQAPNRWAEYDAGQAAVSFCLQATALGLVTHQMGGFDADKVHADLGVPENVTPMAALALGYQGDAESLDDGFKAIEQAPRARKPLAEIAFMGQWVAAD